MIDISRIVLLTSLRGYKMYSYKIKTSFFSPEMPKAQVKYSGFNLMIVHLYIFVENWI